MEEIIKDDEKVVDVEPKGEVIELDAQNEEYEPSLGESIAALAILTTPLVVSYAIGVITSDGVKASISDLKTRFEMRKIRRKEKLQQIRETRKKNIIEIEPEDPVED